MEKVRDKELEYIKYVICTFKEEYDIFSKLESLGFNIGIRPPCDCDDPLSIEAKKIVNIDSLREILCIAQYLSNVLDISVYPKIYSNEDLGEGFYLYAHCNTHIYKECELFDAKQYVNTVYAHKPRFAKLE